MKLKTVPTGVLERLLAFGNRLPVPIAETFGALMLARAIEGANNLGVFNYLGKHGPKRIDEICAALGLRDDIMEALLHALAGSGYLIEEGGAYRNTPMAQRFLVEGSPQYVGNFVRYNDQQRMIWLMLEHIARGRERRPTLSELYQQILAQLMRQMPPEDRELTNLHHGLRDPEIWHNYMYGLKDLANLSLPELQLYLRFGRGMKRLLDIGGGHGAYSIWMCRRYPGLKAVIYDLEGAAAVGREIVAKEGLSHRIEYVTGDLASVESFGAGDFDAAFCFNLIHHLRPDESRALFRKVSRALRRGGSFVVWEEFRDSELKEDDLARFVGVMFLLASGGDTYSFEQVTGWMKESGFGGIKRFRMKSAPGTGLLWGKLEQSSDP